MLRNLRTLSVGSVLSPSLPSPRPPDVPSSTMTVVRVFAAIVLLLVAASSPVMASAAAEYYSGRKFYGVFEGDWLFWFGLLAGATSLWVAIDLLRRSAGALRGHTS